MIRRSLTTGLLILAIAASASADILATDRANQELTIRPNGVLVIDNVQGTIDVIAGDEPKLQIIADRVIRAADASIVAEARQVVHRVLEGTENTRIIRTVMPSAPNPRWSAQVNYKITIPRTANLKINSRATARIRVADIRGNVVVKNMIGPVLIENAGGRVEVDNVNGDIHFIAPRAVAASARLSSINGSVIVRTPGDANFVWESDTVMGEARTAFDIGSGRYLSPTRFRGSVNTPGNVTIVTETFAGNVLLMPLGADDTSARPLRAMFRSRVVPERPAGGVGPMLPATNNRADVRLPLVQGFYGYKTSIGDVRIGEIRGATRIATGAGEVHLGTVFGHCEVTSGGGPLVLGEIIGPLNARTHAGDVTVQRAREGGSIFTGGGTIQMQYTGGPTRLESGGGDIVVRQANGPINAETRSGDISLTVDPDLKSARVEAKTTKGNVAVTLPAGFGADVEAVVITSDPAAQSIRSDFAGLSLQRDQVGGKTRIRATGKLNGGGERLEIHVTDGDIHIVTGGPRVSPMVPPQ